MGCFLLRTHCILLLAACCLAQQPASDKRSSEDQSSSSPSASSRNSSNQSSSSQSSERDREAQVSSSRDTRIDISPPKDDAKSHPDSKSAIADLEATDEGYTSDVGEFHPWNPMKALKDIEVGDFYYKRKNYKAALDRYKEALYYKDNDAVASFRLAECHDKLGNKEEARKFYAQYLKILPEGPLAKDAHVALDRLSAAK